MVARPVALKVEEVVEEVVQMVGVVAPPDFCLLVLHEMVLHERVLRKVVLHKRVLDKVVLSLVVLPPMVLLMGVLQVEGVVVEEAWVELLLGLKYFGYTGPKGCSLFLDKGHQE